MLETSCCQWCLKLGSKKKKEHKTTQISSFDTTRRALWHEGSPAGPSKEPVTLCSPSLSSDRASCLLALHSEGWGSNESSLWTCSRLCALSQDSAGGGGGGEQGPRSVLVRGGGRLEGEAPASFSGVWNDPPLGRDGPAKALLRDCSGQDEGRQWGEQLTLKE